MRADTAYCPISPAAFLPQEFKEEVNSGLFLFELMSFHLTVRPNPSPSPRQACLPKQVRLDRHRVKAGHFFLGVRPLYIELIWLTDHAGMIVFVQIEVQREF